MKMVGSMELSQLVVCLGIFSMAATQNILGDFMEKFISRPLEEEVQFRLFTRRNRDKGIVMKHDGEVGLNGSSEYNLLKETKFIVHGYDNKPTDSWVMDIKNNYLHYRDFNIITLDWSKRVDMLALASTMRRTSDSSTFRQKKNESIKTIRSGKDKLTDDQLKPTARILYPTSVDDVTPVGKLMAKFIDNLVRKFKGSGPNNMHLIGHSLGAHVCGVAGAFVTSGKIGRITGLDPAHPLFNGTDEIKRLDKSDALFVDVIHTDTVMRYNIQNYDRFGYRNPCGHADFYPNGGAYQPDCGFIEGLLDCDHNKAYEYFIESIKNPGKYPAYKCRSLEVEIVNTRKYNGSCDNCCDRCPEPGAYMGAAASPTKPGLYYVYTKMTHNPSCNSRAMRRISSSEQTNNTTFTPADINTEQPNKATFAHIDIQPELVIFIVCLSSRTVLCH